MKKGLLAIFFGFLGLTLMAQTQFEANFKDLPKSVQKYVQKNYDGWTIEKAMMEESSKGKMTSCDVIVTKTTEKFKLIFDKDGEFVKKEAIAQPAAAPATTAPVAKPATAVDTTKKKN